MRLRVWINPNYLLLVGCMIKRDDGVLTWIEFRYERVYKVCKRCGIVRGVHNSVLTELIDRTELIRLIGWPPK